VLARFEGKCAGKIRARVTILDARGGLSQCMPVRWSSVGAVAVLSWSCSGSESSPGTEPSPSGGTSSGGAPIASGGNPAPQGGTAGPGSGGSKPATGGVAPSGGSGPSAGQVGTGGAGSPTGGAAAGGAAAGGSAGAEPLAGSGGAPAGGSAGGPAGGKSGGVGCSGTELLCEDFEDTADGEVPSAAPWHALDASCEFQASQFTMGVTGMLANGGSKSLKITNKHFAQCRLSAAFDPVDDFWVRAYSYWETGLDITNRETLDIDLTPGFRTADDPAVRFGYRSKAPCEEYAGPQVTIIGLAGGEATGCGSREMPKGKWFCFEAHVQQSGVLTVSTFIDGEAISYQSTGKPMTTSVSTEGAVSQKIDHIRLGIFSTGEAQGSIYLDDVAVSATRPGCGK